MTGAGLKNRFLTRASETGSGYWDNTTLNEYVASALINLIDPKVEQYNKSKKITREMQPIIYTTAPITPTSGEIDLSKTSATIPTFYSEIKVVVTAAGITNTATIADLNDSISPYASGTARYPKYYIEADKMVIQPSTATSVTVTYFIAPVEIDVTDDAATIPYNDKVLDLLVSMMLVVAGIAERDPWLTQQGEAQATKEP